MRHRRRPTFAVVSDRPISDLNTTPLIDVMLVLLIMFIITIPLTTHSVKIDLPQGPVDQIPKEPETHDLYMDSAGRISWDGRAITEAALPATLKAFRARDPEGHLRFQVDPQARYEDFDRVLATVKRARIDRLGFVGNEGHARTLDG
ncbi:MAG TPA: biopolymer transporter ExbD [Allosphingosinicella sp.]|jgi:biopolymer transport protein ExbD